MQHIVICAGEASGDFLGAELAKSLLAQNDSLVLTGMGGKKMKAAHVNLLVNSDELAIIGLSQLLKQFKNIRRAYYTLKKYIENHPPDLIILIDYPGFNFRIAKLAKAHGIKIMYYASPQIWAWRYHRIKFIKNHIDHMAVLYDFEEKIYQKENIPVTFVGHPLSDIAKPNLTREDAFAHFECDPNAPIITLCAGSRESEIRNNLPPMMDAIPLILEKLPNAQFLLPLASTVSKTLALIYIRHNVKIIQNDLYNALAISDAAIATSGTVTLEIALNKVPMVVIYKMPALSGWLAKKFVKIDHFSLCNIISNKTITKELFQKDVTANNIANEVVALINNRDYRKFMIDEFSKLSEKLGCHSSMKAAKTALALIHSAHPTKQ